MDGAKSNAVFCEWENLDASNNRVGDSQLYNIKLFSVFSTTFYF